MSKPKHVAAITKQRSVEVQKYAKNHAVAHAGVSDSNGNSLKVWLINTNELAMGTHKLFDMAGNVQLEAGQPTAVKTGGGVLISKNSKLAEYIIKQQRETFEIPSPRGVKRLKLNAVTTYVPDRSSVKAYDLKGWESSTNDSWRVGVVPREAEPIKKEEEVELLLDDLLELEDTQDFQDSNTSLIDSDEHNLTPIDHISFEDEELPIHLNRYVSETAELKYQPILDPWQEESKRENYFNGVTTILDGGPGTGKTTTLIQRIKFLIDPAALEDYGVSFSESKRSMISAAVSNWVFYTPNELLKLYLKESMVREGLLANDQTVRVWQSERTSVMKLYGLISPGESSGNSKFLHQRNSHQCYRYEQARVNELLKVSELELSEGIAEIIKEKFSEAVRKAPNEFVKSSLNRALQQLSVRDKWTYVSILSTVNSITVGQLRTDLDDLILEYRSTIAKLVDLNKLQISDFEFFDELLSRFLKSLGQDDDPAFAAAFRQDLLSDENDGVQAKNFFRKAVSQLVGTNLNSLDDFELKLINTEVKKSLLLKAKELNAFILKIRQIVINPFNLLLQQWLPDAFLVFKERSLKDGDAFYFQGYRDSQSNYKLKHLHVEEQSLVIRTLNLLVDIIVSNGYMNSRQLENSKVAANSQALRKTVIAIDEVTDLHPIDIASIHSFKTAEIASVTLCGDLAQRLTGVGLRRWEDLSGVLNDFSVKLLQLSYRQGPKVLAIAEEIYKKATERDHEFISYFDSSDEEPDPLYKITLDKATEVKWLVERVLEIYRAHGNKIPSIAVFVPEESDVNSTAQMIRDYEELVELDIKCVACNEGQALGDSNSIRVFSIDYIKGLEFEAVFFLNIDKVLETRGRRIGLRLIYVGLSRAAFYLGITSSKSIEELNLANGFNEVSNW